MVVVFSTERKWLRENIEHFMMLNRRRRFHCSSRVKLPLVNMSASWFLASTYLIWILVSKLILSNNQGQCDSVGSRHVSHRRTSSFDDHLDHCLVILKNVHLCFTLTRFCVCILVPFFPQPDVSNAQAVARCSLDSAFICRILLG